MKTKLSDLTLAEFIDMECGDLDVLKDRHELVTFGFRSILVRQRIQNYQSERQHKSS